MYLVVSVCSYVFVFSIMRSVGAMSIMFTVGSNVVVSMGVVGSVMVKSMVTIMRFSVSAVSTVVAPVGTIMVSSARMVESGAMVITDSWMGFGSHHHFSSCSSHHNS